MESENEVKRIASGVATSSEQERAAVRRLVDVLGERRAAAKIGVSVSTLNRIGAGSPVRRAGLIALRVAAGLPVRDGGE